VGSEREASRRWKEIEERGTGDDHTDETNNKRTEDPEKDDLCSLKLL